MLFQKPGLLFLQGARLELLKLMNVWTLRERSHAIASALARTVHSSKLWNSSRRRRSTRHFAVKTACSLIPSSLAIAAAGFASTTNAQQAFQVVGLNSFCI